jgi:hypothetical protein
LRDAVLGTAPAGEYAGIRGILFVEPMTVMITLAETLKILGGRIWLFDTREEFVNIESSAVRNLRDSAGSIEFAGRRRQVRRAGQIPNCRQVDF